MPSPTQERGSEREALAERILARRGYQVVERNWRGGGGEVDRVAWDGEVLCFVEVRSRAHDLAGRPEETVDAAKRRRLVRAARAYLLRFPPDQMPAARFDVVGIILGPDDEAAEVTIIENAFDGRGRPT